MKRKYIPTFEQFAKTGKFELVNEKKANENVFTDAASAVGKGFKKAVDYVGSAISKGLSWVRDIFSHPSMKTETVAMGGKRAAFYEGGKLAMAYYDFGGKAEQAPAQTYDVDDSRYDTGGEEIRESLRAKLRYPDKSVDVAKGFAKRDFMRDVKNQIMMERVAIRARRQYKKMNEAVIPLTSRNPNIPNVNKEDLMLRIDRTFKYKTEPVFIWGAPGIGKTQIMEQYCRDKGVGLIIFMTSTKDPTDFVGLPSAKTYRYTDLDTGQKNKDVATVAALPMVWPRSNRTDGAPLDGTEKPEDLKGGVIFLDELNTAPEPVLNGALQLLGSRGIDSYTLPSNWVIIAAGNRDEEGIDLKELGFALPGRTKSVNFVPSVDDWVDWAKTDVKFKDDSNPFKGILTKNVEPEIIAFILTKPEYFHKMDRDEIYADTDVQAAGYPSPRTWTYASRTLAIIKSELKERGRDLGSIPTSEMVKKINSELGDSVGIPAASAFSGFLIIYNEIKDLNLELAYTNPEKANFMKPVGKTPTKQNEYSPDKAYAFAIALADLRSSKDPSRKVLLPEELLNFVKYLIKVNNSQIASVAMSSLKDNNPIISTPDFSNNEMVQDAMILFDDHYQLSKSTKAPTDPAEYAKFMSDYMVSKTGMHDKFGELQLALIRHEREPFLSEEVYAIMSKYFDILSERIDKLGELTSNNKGTSKETVELSKEIKQIFADLSAKLSEAK